MIEILPCRLAHLRQVARAMRQEERDELAALGAVPRHALIACWRGTPGPLAATVDGRVAAVWGDEGALLDPLGRAWLFTTPLIERVPLLFFRVARHWLEARLRVRRELRSHVAASHPKALRFYRLLGFAVSEPVPVGPKAALFCEIRLSVAH